MDLSCIAHPLRISRRRLTALALLLLISAFPAASRSADEIETLAPGSPAPDFDLPGIDGKNHRLADYADAGILAVLFTCNHCPSAQGAESRIKKLVEDYADRGFRLVAISPNDPEAIRINELGYSVYGDSLADMKKHAEDYGFNFPYLYDGETQAVSRAYGVTATPQIFLFDKDRILRYAGRIDDSRYGDPATIQSHDARAAIEALLAGKAVPVEQTRAHGCSTKWADKRDLVAKFNAEFEARKVTLEPIQAAGVEALMANKTDKLRLINLWATWCGPCVAELPSLVEIGRQFETRGFDLVTISVDDPAARGQVSKLLERCHAAMPALTEASVKEEGRSTNNYHWTASPDDLAELVDPEWSGALPMSLLVAPGGKVIHRQAGEIDADEWKRRIVARLGRFYTPK